MMRLVFAFVMRVACALVLGFAAMDAFAAEEQAFQNRFKDVASELRCPTCVGLSVLESDAPFSKQIKDEVTNQIKAGKSDDEILAWFTDRYGPWILRVPPKTGVNVLAWAIPLVALLLGPLALWFFVWRHREDVRRTDGVKPLDELLSDWETELDRARRRGGIS
ncbi:MAG: hypothetical protein RIQ81_2556 [Pseudomonadota bacterium]|jgi:cytochrome c-type biogenesis protein CcmH/NrfF